MYEVGTAREITAFHQMPGKPGPEGEPHPHDYRIEVVVGRDRLDDAGMVCDLDLLDKALDELVGRIEGRDLEEIRPAEVEAVTVEVFARWVHRNLEQPVGTAGGEHLAVRVWESATAFGGYAASISA